MKDEQLIPAAGTVGFGPDTPQQVCIAFRIKHDGDVTTPNILGDQQLGETRFANTSGTQYQTVAHAFTQIHRNIQFIGFNTMNRRVPTDRRQRPDRIQQGVGAQQLG
ncbi:hypothetical protein D3C80_1403270 [compost metagenome]